MSSSFAHRLVIGLCILYLVAIAVMWWVGGKYAARQTEELLQSAQKDLIVTLNDYLDHLLVANALKIIDKCGTYEVAAQSDLDEFRKIYNFDEINIIDPNGIEIASTVQDVVGRDMKRSSHTAEFLQLLDGKTMVHTQPLRHSVDEPNKRFKYCGVAFMGGKGFIQVGYEEEHFKKGFPIIFRTLTQSWRIGHKGYYVFANAETNAVVSEPNNRTGLFLSDLGFDVAAIPDDENISFRQILSNQCCICRSTVFAGHRLIAVIPQNEFQRNLAQFILLFAVILFLFLAFLTSMLLGAAKSNEQLKAFIKEKQEMMHKEMNVAKTIQASALPCVFPPYPNILEFDIYATMKTAKQVGGDFYDFFFIDNDFIAFLIADVSGKGIPAAMFMMTAKTTIRSVASSSNAPADILAKANARLAENNDADMFVTLWLGILDPKTGILTYSNAGHNFPIIKRADKSIEWVRSKPSLVLAAMPEAKYKSFELVLRPGDTLFLYTDGITEAVNPALELYGEKRLEEAIAKSTGHFCTDVEKDVMKFSDGAEQADDMTMLTLKYRGAPVTHEKTFPVSLVTMPDISGFLGEILRSTDCPQKFISELQIANDEIISNIVKFSGAKQVTLRIDHVPVVNIWRLTYLDDGTAWNPMMFSEPDTTVPLEDRPVGGLGVLLYKKLVDQVRYVRENDQNVIQLRKTLREY
jgi:serine phosphatase RsbU (regulator of sigma subunit)/anti-sigma regulatory factor (Ser/Thr protein kinase)